MKKIDLHMHTSASDGTWDVYKLKEELIKNKINIFSITDHDNIDNTLKMEEIIDYKDNLQYIHGVELTTTFEGREYHLTTYNYNETNKDLIGLMIDNTNVRLDFNAKFMKNYIFKHYSDVCLEEYEQYEYDRSKGGWKSANYLMDRGIHRDLSEHFSDIKNSGMKMTFKKPEEVISIAKKSGGMVFLAHPSANFKSGYMPEKEMKFWLEVGVDGIECFSPYNTKYVDMYVEFCKNNNLMISGGSDCHGEFIPSRKLGVPNIEIDTLRIEKLLN